uniref:LAGLIDADG homing endonuclease n=1 Tax=Romanomermis culicivorax TaxID=13658 RepID=A0A915KAX7_ROMCU
MENGRVDDGCDRRAHSDLKYTSTSKNFCSNNTNINSTKILFAFEPDKAFKVDNGIVQINESEFQHTVAKQQCKDCIEDVYDCLLLKTIGSKEYNKTSGLQRFSKGAQNLRELYFRSSKKFFVPLNKFFWPLMPIGTNVRAQKISSGRTSDLLT